MPSLNTLPIELTHRIFFFLSGHLTPRNIYQVYRYRIPPKHYEKTYEDEFPKAHPYSGLALVCKSLHLDLEAYCQHLVSAYHSAVRDVAKSKVPSQLNSSIFEWGLILPEKWTCQCMVARWATSETDGFELGLVVWRREWMWYLYGITIFCPCCGS